MVPWRPRVTTLWYLPRSGFLLFPSGRRSEAKGKCLFHLRTHWISIEIYYHCKPLDPSSLKQNWSNLQQMSLVAAKGRVKRCCSRRGQKRGSWHSHTPQLNPVLCKSPPWRCCPGFRPSFMTKNLGHIWLYQSKYYVFRGLADGCTYSEDPETVSWPPPMRTIPNPGFHRRRWKQRIVWGLCVCVLFCFFKPG